MAVTTRSRFKAERLRKSGDQNFWIVRVWRDHTWNPVAFVEKFDDDAHTTNPFKVFRMVCGQGPVHAGDMVHVDYEATVAEDAVRNAYRVGALS